MDDDERIVYDSMLTEYRQALADSQLALARANGQNTVLTLLLEQATEPD